MTTSAYDRAAEALAAGTPLSRAVDSFVRIAEVEERTGLHRATIYRKIKAGTFPAPVRLSVNCSAWYATDVARWFAAPESWTADAA